ncbi:hypothetical protein [Hymenobacter sp.]|uniref:hypothetical protein n=1 Tax=Hymenobacter sp. TaxID=1898978 RepID=UPI00286B8644|nr:hypothetical protein [Hymenobacter sp.]
MALFILPILFAAAFAFSMVILIVGSWVARILGFINGNRPNLFTLFSQISAVFAILFMIGFIIRYEWLASQNLLIN